jgi:hypothetical protein
MVIMSASSQSGIVTLDLRLALPAGISTTARLCILGHWPEDRRVMLCRWQVRLTPARLPSPGKPRSFVSDLPAGEWGDWLVQSGLRPGTPYLLSPEYVYDVELNEFFQDVRMLASASNTQFGYARDVAGFLTFVAIGVDAVSAQHYSREAARSGARRVHRESTTAQFGHRGDSARPDEPEQRAIGVDAVDGPRNAVGQPGEHASAESDRGAGAQTLFVPAGSVVNGDVDALRTFPPTL